MVAGDPPPILERRRRAGRGRDGLAPRELTAFDLDRTTLALSGRREGREIRFLFPAHENSTHGLPPVLRYALGFVRLLDTSQPAEGAAVLFGERKLPASVVAAGPLLGVTSAAPPNQGLFVRLGRHRRYPETDSEGCADDRPLLYT